MNEIRSIIRISRRNLDLLPDDIIKSVVDGYEIKTGLNGFFDKINRGVNVMLNNNTGVSRPLLSEILNESFRLHQIPEIFIRSKSKNADIVIARQQYYLVSYLFRYKKIHIAEELNTTHATAIHHIRRALFYCNTYDDYYYQVTTLISQFQSQKTVLLDRLHDELKIEKDG